jgi:hypothetical protein
MTTIDAVKNAIAREKLAREAAAILASKYHDLLVNEPLLAEFAKQLDGK